MQKTARTNSLLFFGAFRIFPFSVLGLTFFCFFACLYHFKDTPLTKHKHPCQIMTMALLPSNSILPSTINVSLYHPVPTWQNPKTSNTRPLAWASWGKHRTPFHWSERLGGLWLVRWSHPARAEGGISELLSSSTILYRMLYNITFKVSSSPLPSYSWCCTLYNLTLHWMVQGGHKWAALHFLIIVQPDMKFVNLTGTNFRQKNFTHGERELPRRGGISELSSTTRIDATLYKWAALYHLLCTTSHFRLYKKNRLYLLWFHKWVPF